MTRKFLLLATTGDRAEMARTTILSVNKYVPGWELVLVTQEYDSRGLEIVLNAVGSMTHFIPLPERVGMHNAKQIGIQRIFEMVKQEPFVVCSIDDDMEFASRTRFSDCMLKLATPGVGLTSDPTYKWVTWGKILDRSRHHYTFYPIYDWSYIDVWKAIHDNGWPYNKVYDLMYQYGVPVHEMRVSNLHHETAVKSLFFLQEVDKTTYNALVKRLSGIDTAGKAGKDDFFVKELPFMFKDWKEYRDFLLDKLIEEQHKASFAQEFRRMDEKYCDMVSLDSLYRIQVQSIIINDFGFTKMKNWEKAPAVWMYRKYKAGKLPWEKIAQSKYNGFIKPPKQTENDGVPVS